MKRRASEVADLVGGRLVGPDVGVEGASIDSRELRPGSLFVAVVAERDGHQFIEAALHGGASAYLTSQPPVGGSAIVVDDTVEGLSALGRAARRGLPDRVVGITGSVGKTTVKDLTASVLGTRYRTAASHRSFNNELGVPLTLVNTPDATEAVVVEMGARGVGHISQLCEIARPTIGVVTTVGVAHTELFGTLEQVVRAKGELVESLPMGGTAILNADVPDVAAMAARTEADVVTFGLGPADVRAAAVKIDPELRARFVLESPWGTTDVRLGIRGEHQVANALAAAAAGLIGGVDLAGIAEGLASAELSPWRMDLREGPSGALVLNDAYNANPASMSVALRSLARLDAERRTAVLGPMAELGAQSEAEHSTMAALADELGVRLIAVAAPAYGPTAEHAADLDAAVGLLGPLASGDAVLVKGSRVAGLERLADLLLHVA